MGADLQGKTNNSYNYLSYGREKKMYNVISSVFCLGDVTAKRPALRDLPAGAQLAHVFAVREGQALDCNSLEVMLPLPHNPIKG